MPLSRLAAAVAIALLILAGCAEVDGEQKVLADAGLLGTWAPDCSKPPGQDALYSIFAVKPDGTVMRLLDRGFDDDHDYDYTISSAHRVAPDQVAMHLGNSKAAFDVVLQVQGNRYRSFQSTAADGTVIIKDGVILRIGAGAAWQTKCR